MKLEKLEEILNSLKDKDADVVLDTFRTTDDYKPNTTYDLTTISIEDKDRKTVIKLSFEERFINDKKSNCRMRNMNINLDSTQDCMENINE